MVAKGFLAAAAIIICCSTTLRGNDPDEKCPGGDCKSACSDKQQCSADAACCADGPCDDQHCCETEQVAVEKCANEKCAAEECSIEKCSTEKCSAEKSTAGECAKSPCSGEKCALETCATKKCAADVCSDGKCRGEKCTFTVAAGGACDSLKCALAGIAKEACTVNAPCATAKCSGGTCSAEKCSVASCAKGTCNGGACPVAACATQVCDVLKSAVQACTTASDDVCCEDADGASETCGATQCATLDCGGQDCPAGACREASCSDEVCHGLQCAVGLSLTSSGGQLTLTATKTFASEPAPPKCSVETCESGTCSTSECAANAPDQCATSACSTATCASSKCSATKCQEGACSTVACNAGKCSVDAGSAKTCATSECAAGASGKTPCAAKQCVAGTSALETKLAELERLKEEIAVLRLAGSNAESYIVDVKMVELNRTRCRSLGFDLEFADGCATNEFASQTCQALEQRNLAKVLFNPTLYVTSDRKASLAVGNEHARVNADGQVVSEFVGKKLDLVASSLGGDRVRLCIAPTISENCGSDDEQARTRLLKLDCSIDATVGKTVVVEGPTLSRVCSVTTDGGSEEEVEEIQTVVLVTVNRPTGAARPASVRQAAYEKTLVEAVQQPKFITVVYPVPDLQVWKVRPQGVQFDADLLIAHIKATVEPQSWRGAACGSPADAEHADGAIQPFERNGSLVICQTEANHERITQLFRQMRVAGREKEEARQERELRDGGVTPASAEAPVERDAKCAKGQCSESKCSAPKDSESTCSGGTCHKTEASTSSGPAEKCSGECQGECDGSKCDGACPETASCPCVGGACTR